MRRRSVRPSRNRGGRLAGPCLVVSCTLALVPSQGSAQSLFGDPSSRLGGLGRWSVEVGGSAVARQELSFDGTSVPFELPARTLTLITSEYTDDMESEQMFLTATVGLGRLVDVFGTVGSAQVKGEGFNGERSLAGGGGIRFSPPESGPVRVGMQLQAFRSTGKDLSISGVIVAPDASPGDSDQVELYATGPGREEVTITRYDALLGFGVHTLPYLRPYGGLLFTALRGRDAATVTGQASYLSCPRAGGTCTPGSGTFEVAADGGFESKKLLGAVVGAVVNATSRWGFTVEGRFLSQTAYGVAAHFRA